MIQVLNAQHALRSLDADCSFTHLLNGLIIVIELFVAGHHEDLALVPLESPMSGEEKILSFPQDEGSLFEALCDRAHSPSPGGVADAQR
jgi:hypothetical protein